jgi:hypothetical protein
LRFKFVQPKSWVGIALVVEENGRALLTLARDGFGAGSKFFVMLLGICFSFVSIVSPAQIVFPLW